MIPVDANVNVMLIFLWFKFVNLRTQQLMENYRYVYFAFI